jgi:hypothetical protein
LGVEDREQTRNGVGVLFDGGSEPNGGARVAGFEVRLHQFLFASEHVVQRRLGHAGAFDDPVDADGLDAFVVEEFIGGVEQPFPG